LNAKQTVNWLPGDEFEPIRPQGNAVHLMVNRRDDGAGAAGQPMMLAGHPAEFDSAGRLMPWTSWNTALDREMVFYQQWPPGSWLSALRFHDVHGWRVGAFFPIVRTPFRQPRMEWHSSRISNTLNCAADRITAFLRTACLMGDYVVNENAHGRARATYPAFHPMPPASRGPFR